MLSSPIRVKAIGAGLVALVLVAPAGPIAAAYGTPVEWPCDRGDRDVRPELHGLSRGLRGPRANAMGFGIALSESAVEGIASLTGPRGRRLAGAVGGRAIGYTAVAVLAGVSPLAVRTGSRLRGEAAGPPLRRIASYAGALS